MAISNNQLIPKQKGLSFKAFWLDIAELIGEIELPITEESKGLKEITKQMDDEFNPLKQCLISLYKDCRCKNLNSTICPIRALDILGLRCHDLKRRKSGVDLKDIDLLEHIGIHIVDKYLTIMPSAPKKNTFALIKLDWYKTRQANLRN